MLFLFFLYQLAFEGLIHTVIWCKAVMSVTHITQIPSPVYRFLKVCRRLKRLLQQFAIVTSSAKAQTSHATGGQGGERACHNYPSSGFIQAMCPMWRDVIMVASVCAKCHSCWRLARAYGWDPIFLGFLERHWPSMPNSKVSALLCSLTPYMD